jgi:hypothetical protein
MKLRTLALALALSCAAVTAVPAASQSNARKVKPRKGKNFKPRGYKAHKAPKVKKKH